MYSLVLCKYWLEKPVHKYRRNFVCTRADWDGQPAQSTVNMYICMKLLSQQEVMRLSYQEFICCTLPNLKRSSQINGFNMSELLFKTRYMDLKTSAMQTWNKTNGAHSQLLTLCSTKEQFILWFLWLQSIGCPGLEAGHCHFIQEGWHHQNDSLTDALNTWHTRSIFGLSCPPDHKLGVVRKHRPAVKMHNGKPLLMQKKRSIEWATLWIWNMGYICNH